MRHSKDGQGENRNAESVPIRLAFCYRRWHCPQCKSRMVTFVWHGNDNETLSVGCSVCKRRLTDGEFRQAEELEWDN